MLSLVYCVILRSVETFECSRFQLTILLYPFYTTRVSNNGKAGNTIWLEIHIE